MPIPFVAMIGGAVARAAATTAARAAVSTAARGAVQGAVRSGMRIGRRLMRRGRGRLSRGGRRGAAGGGQAPDAGKQTAALARDFTELAGSASKVAGAFRQTAQQIDDWKDGVLESSRALSSYNGTIAAANAKLEVGDIRRNLDAGRATAASAKALTESEDARRESAQGQRNFWAGMSNRAATFWNNTNTVINRGVNAVFGFKQTTAEGDDERGGRTQAQYDAGVEDSMQGYFFHAMTQFRPSEEELHRQQNARPMLEAVAPRPQR